jgi:hypothetical protein
VLRHASEEDKSRGIGVHEKGDQERDRRQTSRENGNFSSESWNSETLKKRTSPEIAGCVSLKLFKTEIVTLFGIMHRHAFFVCEAS